MKKFIQGLATLGASVNAMSKAGQHAAQLAQTQTQTTHLYNNPGGGKDPCPPTAVCNDDQYLIRTDDADDCTCRYYEQECCADYAFDHITGQCVCLPKVCPLSQQWDYETCQCECVGYQACADINGNAAFWDSEDCMCKCIPQPDSCGAD